MSDDKVSPLQEACQKGDLETVECLLKSRADLEAITNTTKKTLLHLAAENGHCAIVKLLVEEGADIEARTEETDETPLHLAAKHGHFGIVDILLYRGAKKESKTNSGKTPLILAAENGQKEIVESLIESGANIEARTEETNETPLHLAAKNGHFEIVEFLLDAGADKESKTNAGDTPLHFAVKNGHKEIVEFLLLKEATSVCYPESDFTSDEGLTVLEMNIRDLGYSVKLIEDLLQEKNIQPDFLLLQGVTDRQLHEISTNLKYWRTKDRRHKGYLTIKNKESQNKYNTIMYKAEHQVTQIQAPQIHMSEKDERYCAGRFTFKEKDILLVSFHGKYQLDETDKAECDYRCSAIADTDKTTAKKQVRLVNYLAAIRQLQFDHLIIGGGFNLNVDELLELNTDLFDTLELKIIPTNRPKDKNHRREAIICDSGLLGEFAEAKAYPVGETYQHSPFYKERFSEERLSEARLSKKRLPGKTVDPRPLLFTIKIKPGGAIQEEDEGNF
jgi:ankyrin repeat protein